MKRSERSLVAGVLALAAGAAFVAYVPGATAQPTGASADDMRAVYAGPTDVAEGKAVADQSCARCHGAKGISTTPGLPHVAGQRAAYLYVEMVAYRSGARKNEAMTAAVKFLSDDALVKVAAYYASLEPAQPAAVRAARGSAAKDPVQAGKAVAASCDGCHGERGVTSTPGMPNLVGLDPKYVVLAMKAYKSGARKDDMMKSAVATLSDADLENVALYYALQKPARAKTPAPGDQAAGKEAAASCSGCHGEQGVSGSAANPSLAGQDAQYFASAMQAYKSGTRGDETMKGIAQGLDDRAMKNLAAFYAAQSPQAPKVRVPLTTAQRVERCDRCHGVNGNSTDPRSPALAAQRLDYLEQVLRSYRSGVRKHSAMAAMTDGLSDADIDSLAVHYARQRARAVVFVTLPCK
jgi:cytochrome c553